MTFKSCQGSKSVYLELLQELTNRQANPEDETLFDIHPFAGPSNEPLTSLWRLRVWELDEKVRRSKSRHLAKLVLLDNWRFSILLVCESTRSALG